MVVKKINLRERDILKMTNKKNKKRKKNIQSGYMKNQTVLILAIVIFLAGVVSGVFLSVIRTESLNSSPSTKNVGRDFAKEIEELKAKAAQNPQDAIVWTQLGNIYFDTDQYHLAIQAYEKSVKIDSHNPNVLTDLGIMYRRSGKPDQAITYLDKAIKADPKHEMSRLNKGIILMNDLKRRDQALKVWEDLLDINPLAMASKDQSVDEMIKHYREHVK